MVGESAACIGPGPLCGLGTGPTSGGHRGSHFALAQSGPLFPQPLALESVLRRTIVFLCRRLSQPSLLRRPVGGSALEGNAYMYCLSTSTNLGLAGSSRFRYK